jgi:hypothetical protein
MESQSLFIADTLVDPAFAHHPAVTAPPIFDPMGGLPSSRHRAKTSERCVFWIKFTIKFTVASPPNKCSMST